MASEEIEQQKLNEIERKNTERSSKRSNMSCEEIEQQKLNEKERLNNLRKKKQQTENCVFDEMENSSKVEHSIINTDAFNIIKQKFDEAVSEGPEYDCDICFQMCFRRNVRRLLPENYEKDDKQIELFAKCHQNTSMWICNSCHLKLKRTEMPDVAVANNLGLCESVEELTDLTDIEHVLLCQIIPFMSIVNKHRGAQSGIKGQVVLVPTDLQKIQQVLPTSSNADHLITIELKRRLTDKGNFLRQTISPKKVNDALLWLKENNPLYANIQYDENWEKKMQESDPELWSILTEDIVEKNIHTQPAIVDSDSDDDEEREQIHKPGLPYPSVIQNANGPDISSEDIVQIAPGEGKIPINRSVIPDCEALAFPKLFSTGQFHLNTTREKRITPLKYFQSRVKSKDSKFASDPRYVYFATDQIQRDAIHNSINFSQRKSKNVDISAGQLKDPQNVRKMISDEEMFTLFKKIRGTPYFYKDMQYDVFGKIRFFGIYTFFMTWSAAQFQWDHLIKIAARCSKPSQYLTDEEIKAMDTQTKMNILKRNPVAVARQIDHIFQSVWNNVVMSGLHPIGQILNFDERGEFQSSGTKHIHATLHIKDAPKVDVDTDEEVTSFIDKHITCAIPDETKYPELHNLVKRVQTHKCTKTCKKREREILSV